MTLFDYVVLTTVGFSMLLGLWRGVVSELLALVAWVLAFLLAKTWAPRLSMELSPWIADQSLQYLSAFAMIVGVVLLLATLIRLLVRGMLSLVGLGLFDRMLGLAFGLFRGVLLVLFGVMVGGLTMLPKQEWWREAALAPPLETAVVALKPWLPDDWAKRIRYR